MEKTSLLKNIDREICQYIQKHNKTKKDVIFCYQPDRKQISEFYTTMADQIYQRKMKEGFDSKRKNTKETKTKLQIVNNIKNPLVSSVPKEIEQNNLISIDKRLQLKLPFEPMFSEVESTKNNTYVIGEEVRLMITQDIQAMVEKKQEQNFRKKFPAKRARASKKLVIDNAKTENLIKQYNRLLMKYKSDKIGIDPNIKIADESSFQEKGEILAMDNQQFSILDLFKKLYIETKSEDIPQTLHKYIMKFKNYDKISKKVNDRKTYSSKQTLRNSATTTPKSTSQWRSRQIQFNLENQLERERKISVLSQTCTNKNSGFSNVKMNHNAKQTSQMLKNTHYDNGKQKKLRI